MLAARLCNAVQRTTGSAVAPFAVGDIGERDDPDQALVAIDHRQTTHLLLSHVAGCVFDVLVVENVLDVVGHDVAHVRLRTLASATARTAMSRSVIMPSRRS